MRVKIKVFAALLAIILSMALPVFAGPVTASLSPDSGPPGVEVIATALNLTAGSTYTVMFGITTVVATGTVLVDGSVYAHFNVPVFPRGAYNVMVIGTAPPFPTFTITPQIFIDTTSGKVGDQIRVSGNGFNKSEAINIYFDSMKVASINSDSQGVFSNAIITVPQASAGAHNITAKDLTGASPAVTFSVAPRITLSANEVTVGSTISISGSGFAASKAISFLIDNLSINKTVTSDGSGKFTNFDLVVPAMPGGDHTIKAQDTLFNSATITFSVSPSIIIRPNQGPIGTNVTITGNGFLSISNNPITITYNGTVVTTNPPSVAADGNGSFSATFKIPFGASGTGTVTARDNLTTISTNFNSVATVTLNPASGFVGTVITATGIGFKANTQITINYDNSTAGTATTDSEGTFSTAFQALASTMGSHQINVTDQVNVIKFPFNIIPAVKVNPSSGSVGEDITVNGTGFPQRREITVKYDTNQIAKSTTDIDGTFIVVFKAPASEAGNHQITVTDSKSTITSTFVMDSTPPPALTLLSPPFLTKASKIPTLDWQDATDPSSVTYTLQISKDATFDTVILQKQGLASSQYGLKKQEALRSVSKNTPYYWRVKATDSANNESEWSASSTFYVGFILPNWILYTIVAASLLIVGLVSYWIERRRSQ